MQRGLQKTTTDLRIHRNDFKNQTWTDDVAQNNSLEKEQLFDSIISQISHPPKYWPVSTSVPSIGPESNTLSSPPLYSGQEIGPYTLIKCLGSGGFGEVWEAKERQTDQRVALKMLLRLTPSTLSSLKSEVRTLLGLAHPGIVAPFELLLVNGILCFAMELIEGEPLSQWINRPPHPTERLKRIHQVLPQLVDALEFLHQTGFLHLDIKPSNILTRPDGRIAVVDFGLTSRIDKMQTEGRSTVGTPGYMAPEVWEGREVSPATDWFAIGVLIYELVTQQLPFMGQTTENIRKSTLNGITNAPPPAYFLSPSLLHLSIKLMASVPEQRANGQDIRTVLQASSTLLPLSSPTGFVGRQDALVVLTEAWQRCCASQLSVVLLKGVHGIGKTRLVKEFSQRLRDSTTPHFWLDSRCSLHERIPFPAFDSIIEAMVQSLSKYDKSTIQNIIGPDNDVLSRIFTVLTPYGTRPLFSKNMDYHIERTRLRLALRKTFQRLSTLAPVVICIDDVHYLDEDSLALLLELITDPDAPPLLVLLLGREVDQSPMSTLINHSPPAQTHIMTLSGLSLDESYQLLSYYPDTHLFQRCGGNPFLLKILAYDEQNHDHPDHILLQQITRLEEGPRKLLEVLSLASPLRSDVLSEVSDQADIRRHTHILGNLGLLDQRLRDTLKLLELPHEEVRKVVAASIPEKQRQSLHLSIAKSLGHYGGEPGVRAWHLYSGGAKREAGILASEAAECAETALAPHQAARAWKDALDWGDWSPEERQRLSERRAQALFLSGHSSEAGTQFQALLEGSPSERQPFLEEQMARSFLLAGEADRGIEALSPVFSRLGLSRPRRGAWALLSGLISLGWTALRPATWASQPMAAEPLDPKRADACWWAAQGLLAILPAESFALIYRSFIYAERAQDTQRRARVASLLPLLTSQFPGFAWIGRRLQARSQMGTDVLSQAHANLWTAHHCYYTGDLQGMLALSEQSLQGFSASVGVAWEVARARELLLLACWLSGDLLRLDRVLFEALHDAEERGDCQAETNARQLAAVLAVARGNLSLAREHASWIAKNWTPNRYTVAHFFGGLAEVLASLYEGKAEDAAAILQSHEPRFRAAGGYMIPLWRIDWYLLYGRSLAALPTTPARQRELKKIASRLSSETRADAKAHTHYISMVASASSISDVVAHYDSLGLYLQADALALQDHAAERFQLANHRMQTRGVVDPLRFAKALMPLPSVV